jgi:hypothetical protein
MGTRCTECGRLKPHFASGWTQDRAFEYEDCGKCMVCRLGGTKSMLKALPKTGEVLRAWLVTINSRKGRP